MCLQDGFTHQEKHVLHVIGHVAQLCPVPRHFECRISINNIAKLTGMNPMVVADVVDLLGGDDFDNSNSFVKIIMRSRGSYDASDIYILEYPTGFKLPDLDKIFSAMNGD